MKYSRGFTLLEMMVVLVILALLATAASDLLSSEGARLRATTFDLAATLRMLRASALRLSIPTELIPLEDSYRIEPTSETRHLPPGIVLRLRDTPPNLLGISSDHIIFFPDGSSTGGTIAVLQRHRSMFLTIAWLTGQVDIHE